MCDRSLSFPVNCVVMLRVLGSTKRLCAGISRRDVLNIGAVGAGALSLPHLFAREAAAAESAPVPPRAKRILLVYLAGAASQLETFDPKPEAPAETRGAHGSIQTVLPGIRIDEHLPKIAQIMDRLTLIRSMSHPNNNHSNVFTLTGHAAADFTSETRPFDPGHHPFFGSVLDYLADQESPKAAPPPVPRNLALPYQFSAFNPQFHRSGPYGGFLGHGYNPVFTEYRGEATRSAVRKGVFGVGDFEIADPYLGVKPDLELRVSKAAQLRPELTIDRLNRRRSLLDQLESQVAVLDRSRASESLDRHQQMAWSLLGSRQIREALDLTREPIQRRERYGMNLFGQAMLAGRRLLEAGGRVVSVFWDEYKVVNTAWDTHFNCYTRLQNELLPGLDSAFSALILDLEERGMLKDTLVMCLTEHGRTPKVVERNGTVGRDHWSEAYCSVLAGAGFEPGRVYGSTDREAAYVLQDPVSPLDILATMYHLVGIDPHATIPDRQGRPVPLVAEGRILTELLV